MPRAKEIEISGLTVNMTEMKIKDLEALARELETPLNMLFKSDNVNDVLENIEGIIYPFVTKLCPNIQEDSVNELYPSELEKIASTFVELHFFALKSLLPGLVALVQAGTKGKM